MKILYIAGSGRSGSTLLERILHSSSQASGVGEFHCLWRLPLEELTCACGLSVSDDPFWRKVLERARVGSDELAQMASIEQELVRTSTITRNRWSLRKLAKNQKLETYRATQRRIYEALAEIGNVEVVVDSSKAGPRAWIASGDPDAMICHLYRDPTDVLMSWRSHKFDRGLDEDMQRPSFRTAAVDWLKVEILTRSLGRRRAVIRLDYEDLAGDPQSCVDALLAVAGLAEIVAPQWSTGNSFHPGPDYHSVNGNPDRFDVGEVHIALRRTDRRKLSTIDWAICQMIGRPLRWIFRPPGRPTG